MSYSFESRIRYSEIGEDECLTLNGIINYFQDCTTFHSEDVGLGMHTLKAAGRAWVLSSWQIVIERYPGFGEQVLVSTWPYAFKGFMGNRNFVLRTKEGELLAYANTLWTFLNLEKGRPQIVDEAYSRGYELEAPFPMEYASRKIPMPKECRLEEAFPVRAYHLDTNHHVNNGQYIQMAREFIPKDYSVYQMRAEYKKQAVLGDIIVPRIYEERGTYRVALCESDGKPYAVVEFTEKENV